MKTKIEKSESFFSDFEFEFSVNLFFIDSKLIIIIITLITCWLIKNTILNV